MNAHIDGRCIGCRTNFAEYMNIVRVVCPDSIIDRDRHIMLFKALKILFLNSSEVAYNSNEIEAYFSSKKDSQAQNRFLVTQCRLGQKTNYE